MIRLFAGHSFINASFVLLYTALLHLPAVLLGGNDQIIISEPLDLVFEFNYGRYINFTLLVLFIAVNAYLLNNWLIALKLFKGFDYLAAFIFVLLTALAGPAAQSISIYLGLIFLQVAWQTSIGLFNIDLSIGKMFNMGIYISIASLASIFYLPFFFFLLVSTAIIKQLRARELIAYIAGFMAIPLIWFTLHFMMDNQLNMLAKVLRSFKSIDSFLYINKLQAIHLITYCLSAVLAFIVIAKRFSGITILIRKIMLLSIVFMLFGIASILCIPSQWPVCLIPIALILSLYLCGWIKNNQQSFNLELIHLILLVFLIMSPYLI